MKLTKKMINTCLENTPIQLEGTDIRSIESVFIGTYQKMNANWHWEVYAISWEGHPFVAATRFGQICAAGK